jgi:hypothetical protein
MSDVNDKREEELLDTPVVEAEAATAAEPPPRTSWRDRLGAWGVSRNVIGVVGAAAGAIALVIIIALSLIPGESTTTRPVTATPPPAPDMTARVEALERRLAQVETAQSTRPTAAPIPSDVTDRIASLESTVAALPKTQTPPSDPAEVADLKRRVDAATTMLTDLTARLDAVELGAEGKTGAPVDTGALTSLRQTTTQLQQAVAELKAKVDAAGTQGATPDPADAGKLAALEKRMAELENQDVDTLTKRAATALAVANLVRATQGSGPFKTELGALALIARDEPALAQLTPHAEAGLPTEAALAERFTQIIPDIIQAEDIANDSWWWERMWTNFSSQITVRKVGDQPGDDARAILGRAEQELKEGDLRGAVDEVAKLTGKPAEAAQSWRQEAEARIALDRMVTDINGRLLAEIATEE